ncbi:hypothetical protein [Prevotella intermedia]|nr:hypothetical protein [Prevotella intermedia]
MINESLSFSFNHSIKVNETNDTLLLFMNVFVEDENEIELAKQGIRGEFKVTPLKEFAQLNGDKITVSNKNIMNTFLNVLIGALRGLLIGNLKNTPLNAIVLPLIPIAVIEKNTIIK